MSRAGHDEEAGWALLLALYEASLRDGEEPRP
jgi:hypothetical protein